MSISVRMLAAMLLGAPALTCFADAVRLESSTPMAIQNLALTQYQRALVDPAYPVVEQMQQSRADLERMVKQQQASNTSTSEKLKRFEQWLRLLQADIEGQRKAGIALRNQFLAGADPAEIEARLASYACADAVKLGEGSFAADLTAQQTVWIELQSDAQHTIQINTIGSTLDTKIAIYDQRCPTSGQVAEALRDDDLGLAARYELPPARAVRKFLAISAEQAGEVQVRVTLADANIRGKVTTPFVNGNNSNVAAGRYENGFFNFVGNANTQSDGTYSISVPANSYYVFAYSNYFSQLLPQLYPAAPCFGQVGGSYCPISNATLLQLADSAVINNIDFNLSEGAIVSGRVTGQRPGETPFVTAYLPENTNVIVQANVDSAGRFRVSGLPATNIKLYAGASGTQSQIYDGINCPQSGCNLNLGASIPIVLGVDRTNINFNLKKLPTISGKILGSPSFTSAVAYDASGNIAFAYTDSFGNYTLTLQPGSYYLSFHSSGFSSKLFENKPCLGPNQNSCTNYASGTAIVLIEQQNLIINTVLNPLGSISGKVLDDLGVPIGGATVGVCAAADSNSCGPNYLSAQVQTNQTGDYRIYGLQSGGYFVIAASRSHLDKAYPDVDCQIKPGVSCNPQFSGARLVVVEDNVQSTAINFSLKRASSISGILSESPYFYYTGVEAARTGFTAGIYSELVTITNNSYKLIDLPAGEYRLIAGRQNSAIFPQIFAYRNCAGTLASPCQINSGDPIILDEFTNVTGKDFNFARRSGASGYVRNINGAPISNVIVDFWAIQPVPLLPQRSYSTLTDSQGRFSLGSNPSSGGNFYLSTDAPNDFSNRIYAEVQCAVGTSAYAGTCSFSGATVLSAPAEIPGQLDNLIFTLPPSGLNEAFLANGFEP